jgi:hypothetical protein
MTVDIVDWTILILSTLVTFGLYSILTGVNNPFFSWAERTYVGGAIGLLTIVAFDYLRKTVVAKVITDPMTAWPWIVSMILGIMMLLRIHPKYAYIARIPIAISTATGVAIAARAIIFTGVIKQITATILPIVGRDPLTIFTNLMVIIFVIVIITFFVYTTEMIERKGPLKVSHDIGRYVLYAAFGALFAMTYMGRLGLFLGRMETLLFPDVNRYVTFVVALIIVITIYIMNKYYPETLKKLVPEE